MPLLYLLSLFAVTASFAADRLDRSLQPPGGLAPREVPQFIILGFDDNPAVEPMAWFVEQLKDRRNPVGTGQSATFDGALVRMVFFSNGSPWKDPALVAIHRRAVADGHELANHTQTHPEGSDLFSIKRWRQEIVTCDQTFLKASVLKIQTPGFRAPNAACGDTCFKAVAAVGKLYDSSIPEDYKVDGSGMNFPWPYTLDAGSQGNALFYSDDSPRRIKFTYPGLWEIPMNAYLVPGDDETERYGITPGLRKRMQNTLDGKSEIRSEARLFQPISGRMNGVDLSYMYFGGATPAEYLVILKHTLDQRLASNRAPLMIIGHTWFYPADQPERRQAMKDFLDYALSKPEVRFVTATQLIDWLRHPIALSP